MLPHPVILLPGIIAPPEDSYQNLLPLLRGAADVILQNLAIYKNGASPRTFSFEAEIAAVDETVAIRGIDRFHLAGASAGGAIAVAYAAQHPERLFSLTLMEPAWLGSDMTEAERNAHSELEALTALQDQEMLAKFVRVHLGPGVPTPPPRPGTPPPWMARGPAGIRAFIAALARYDLDLAALQRFNPPVLYVLGGLTNPALYRQRAERARSLFPNFALRVFEHRHHFDPPYMAEPEKLAGILLAFWARAEGV